MASDPTGNWKMRDGEKFGDEGVFDYAPILLQTDPDSNTFSVFLMSI